MSRGGKKGDIVIRKSNKHKSGASHSLARELSESVPTLMKEYWKRGHAELSSDPLSLPQFWTLEYVHEHDGCSMHELAEALGKPSSTMTGLVNGLIRRDLLARHYGEDDRRIVHVTSTKNGRRMLGRVITRREKILQALFELLDPGEQDAYLKITEKLIAHLATPPKRTGGHS